MVGNELKKNGIGCECVMGVGNGSNGLRASVNGQKQVSVVENGRLWLKMSGYARNRSVLFENGAG
jgi:hypothetical protein